MGHGICKTRVTLTRFSVPLIPNTRLSTQFKFTYISAIIAGLLWLAMERRWKNAAEFSGAAMVASIGIYGIFLQREPQMLAQMFVFRHTITDYRALFGTIGSDLLREPVFLLGAATLPLVALRGWRRWWLLAGYLAISLTLSAALDLHAGGNINYFFEALFILVPLASFGALQLSRCRFGTGPLFLAGLLLFTMALPNALAAYRTVPKARSETASWNSHMNAIRAVLQGNHVLSFVPTATYLAGRNCGLRTVSALLSGAPWTDRPAAVPG